MGAAYDAMCENEGLQSMIASKNRQIKEQKKLIEELAKGIVKGIDGIFDRDLYDKANNILIKANKKKKK